MEYQKKQNAPFRQQKHQGKAQKQKHNFFKEVYQECQKVFSNKEFEFFAKCIIPHRTINNRSSSTHRKSQNSNSQQQKYNNINQINPFVLTMPRRVNYYGERNINNVIPEKHNRRILTTPTEKIRRQITFNTYQDIQLYKRMKIHQQNLTCKIKSKILKPSKMYCPQPLFYPQSRFEVPKTAIVLNTRNRKRKIKNNRKFYEENNSLPKENTSDIPQNFVQMIRFSKYSHPFSTTRARFLKSMR